MDRRTIIFGVGIIIILIIVIGYFMFRKPNDLEDTSGIIPGIVYQDSQMDIKPYPDYRVEEYRIEYETGLYSDAELSKLVDFTIKWNNKGGFMNVKALKFTRSVIDSSDSSGSSGSSLEVKNIYKYKLDNSGNMTDTLDEDNLPYFTNFHPNILSVKFNGSDLGDKSAIGTNNFTIEYSLDGSNYLALPGLTAANMSTTLIKDDIILVMNSKKFTTVVFKPKGVNIRPVEAKFDETAYYFYPRQPTDLAGYQYSLNSILYGSLGRPLYITIGTGTDDVMLLTDDDNYVLVDSSNNIGKGSSGTSFNIIQTNEPGVVIIGNYKTEAGGTAKNINKVVAVVNNRLEYINFDDISDESIYNSIFFTYSDSELINKRLCSFDTHVTAATCASTEANVHGLSNRRGKKITRVTINNKPLGDENCSVTVDGTNFDLYKYSSNDDISKINDTQYAVRTNCAIGCDYEYSHDISKPLCVSKSCWKTEAEKFLTSGLGFEKLRSYDANGNEIPCGDTTEKVDCDDRGFITSCEDCLPEIDQSYCDKTTTTSPRQGNIQTWKKATGTKCFETPQSTVDTWNRDKSFEPANCQPSCKPPTNWKSQTSCSNSTKITTYGDAITRLDYTGQPYCDTPSKPQTLSTPNGCVLCYTKNSDPWTQEAEKACNDLDGCTAITSTQSNNDGWGAGGMQGVTSRQVLTCTGTWGA